MPSMNRRQFLKVTGITLVGASLAFVGFAPVSRSRRSSNTGSGDRG